MSLTKVKHNGAWYVISGDGILLEDELDSTSVNGIQNKVVSLAVDEINEELDQVPHDTIPDSFIENL